MKTTLPTSRFAHLNHLPLSLALGGHTSDILNWGFIDATYWRNYLHTHSCFEVCYAFAGGGTFRIQGRNHHVRAGHLFVARPGEAHEIVSSTHDPLGICFWAYTLLPGRDHLPGRIGAEALVTSFRSPGPWVSARSGDVPLTIRLLEDEITRRDAGYVEAIRALTVKLLLDTCRALVPARVPAMDVSPPRQTPAQQIAQRIVRFLHDNYGRPLTVREVAAEVHLSERHTNRLFRAVMGVSVVEFLTTLRIDAASRLLLERQLPVKEVARAVGYADVHYFTTLFRRRKGFPPAQFRATSGTRSIDTPG